MGKKQIKCTPQQEIFCQAYANIDSTTFNSKYKSAQAAGVAKHTASQTASKWMVKRYIHDRIDEIIEENNLKWPKSIMMAKLEKLRKTTKNDNVKATCMKLQLQTMGYLKEFPDMNIAVERKELDEQQEADLKEYIAYKHRRMLTQGQELLTEAQSDYGTTDEPTE